MAIDLAGKKISRLGKYRIVRQLGSGGMGAVYHAIDEETNTPVALKLLSPGTAHEGKRLERFRREAQHMAKLRHPNIVSLLQFGAYDGTWFLALEFVDGCDLEHYVRQHGPMSAAAAWQVLVQLTQALDHAYERGVVHRDIKPSNILLTERQGRPLAKLADLGLARAAGAAESRVTSDGCTVGTLDYMAPEQARDSSRADTRSDIYSLGCTLYHLLAGAPPFQGSVMERVVKHAKAEPPDLRPINRSVPDCLWDVCRRMLAKRPSDRYQTPAELLIALTSLARLFSEAEASPGPAHPGAASRLATPPSPRPNHRSSHETLSGVGASSRIPPQALSSSRSTAEGELDSPSGVGHRRAALEQYQRAAEALAGGHYDYGLNLLLTCCRLAPGDLTYRQALRQAQLQWHELAAGRPWRHPLLRCLLWLRFELARRRGRWQQVLLLGEELLTCNPRDLQTQLQMADAAVAGYLPDVAIWILEHARGSAPDHVPLLHTLARLYEKEEDLVSARGIWEYLQKRDPHDHEARRNVERLLVGETNFAMRAANETRRPRSDKKRSSNNRGLIM